MTWIVGINRLMSSIERNSFLTQQYGAAQAGSTLIEVLVALLILAVGLLGYLSLVTSGVTVNQRAYTLSQAAFLAEDYADRVRANRVAVGEYNISFGDTLTSSVNCMTTSCTTAQMAEWDKAQWMSAVDNALVGADAEVVINNNTITITIIYSLAASREGTGGDEMLSDLETYDLVTNI